MTEKESVYSNFVELQVFTSEEMPDNKIIRIFKDAEGFFYLAPLLRKKGDKTSFSSISEIEVYLGIKLSLLNIIPNPSKKIKKP